MNYIVNIKHLSQDIIEKAEKLSKAQGISISQVKVNSGIPPQTINSILKRENGAKIRMDVFLMLVTWLNETPSKYFIKVK